MLILYNENNIPQDKNNIVVPWDEYFNDNEITNYFDETDIKIVQDVEQTSLLNNETILCKFYDMPISIGCLSEGCKTLLCINHAVKSKTIEKYVFNLTSCGGNAISYLADVMAKNNEIYGYLSHYDLGLSDNCNIRIDDEIFHDTISAVNKLINIQGDI